MEDAGINDVTFGAGGNGHRDGDDSPDGDGQPTFANDYSNNDGKEDREFQLVNARSINITPFCGRNVQANPGLPFNNAFRRLILVQGKDGEELLDIFDEIEQAGDDKISKEDFKDMSRKCPPPNLPIRQSHQASIA